MGYDEMHAAGEGKREDDDDEAESQVQVHMHIAVGAFVHLYHHPSQPSQLPRYMYYYLYCIVYSGIHMDSSHLGKINYFR